ARAPAANAASSPAKSSSQRPPSRTSGTSITRRRAKPMCWKNGGYTGGLMTTPSPGSVASATMASKPAITSGTRCTRPGSTVVPCRGERGERLADAVRRGVPAVVEVDGRAQRGRHRLGQVVIHLRDERRQHVRRVQPPLLAAPPP